jgi:hypothetical protein
MKQFFTFLAAVVLTATTYAQVGIGTTTPEASAALDITSTTKGLLPPRMTTNERDLISSAATGLIVFNTTLNTLQINEGDATTSNWVSLSAAATSPTYSVNTFYAELGGYVIEVNSDGTHGLVVAMQDQGSESWYLADNLLNYAASHDINGAKFKDWRLPNIRELSLIYDVYIGGNEPALNPNDYWSSSEYRYDTAWYRFFSIGNWDTKNKSSNCHVRTVRVF